MSFMTVAVGLGAEGLGAAMLAGGMMGGATTFGMNILSGRNAFSNMGQGMLMGAAGSGLVSGLGAAAGGVGNTATSTIAGDMATPSYSEWERTQALSELLDKTPIANPPTVAPIGTPPPPAVPAELPEWGTQAFPKMGNTPAPGQFDPSASQVSASQTPVTTQLPPVQPAYGSPTTTGMDTAATTTTTTTRPPAEFMKNPADYMVQNPSKVAGVGMALNTMLNPQQPGIANPLTDKTGYSPKFTWDQKTQKYVSAAPAPYTYKGAEGGEIRGYKAGGPYKEVTPGPYKEGVSGPIYGEDTSLSSKKGPYEDTDMYSSIKSKIERMSPSMLDRLSKGAKDPIVQAAATTELYDRSNSVNSYISQPTTQAAKGGIMSLDNSYAAGGDTTSQYNYDPSSQTYTPPSQPQAASNSGDLQNFVLRTLRDFAFGKQASPSQKYSYDPKQQQYTKMAQGGVASLGGDYAAGGKLLQGPGDGMSDSIPAVIQGAKPQRAALAQGEFVIPADVVSHLGNGSTNAGAKRLYAMMDKIRHARTGNKKQGRQINPDRFLPT